METRPDTYISVDIEADGPIPGVYSMLSIGMTLAGTFDGTTFEAIDPTTETFYAELKPISDDFDPQALAVAGLDRDLLRREGEEPAAAMSAAADWVDRVADGTEPVFVSWPTEFDWMFTHWYFIRFNGRDPFGHSSCIDSKSFYVARARLTLSQASQRALPPELESARPHTHNALDDAMSHAEVFAALFEWRPPERAAHSDTGSG